MLLFVAFELMSIPLYVLTGFLKREPQRREAALKFFLVGTVSSAVIAYGMSFMYGVDGHDRLLGADARGDGATGHPLMMLGLALAARRASGSRSPRSRSTCGCPTPTRPRARRSSPGSRWRPRRRASS